MAGVVGLTSSSPILQLINQLQQTVTEGQRQQVEFATKLLTLAVSQTIDNQSQATIHSALDKVV